MQGIGKRHPKDVDVCRERPQIPPDVAGGREIVLIIEPIAEPVCPSGHALHEERHDLVIAQGGEGHVQGAGHTPPHFIGLAAAIGTTESPDVRITLRQEKADRVNSPRASWSVFTPSQRLTVTEVARLSGWPIAAFT